MPAPLDKGCFITVTEKRFEACLYSSHIVVGQGPWAGEKKGPVVGNGRGKERKREQEKRKRERAFYSVT